MRRKLSGGAASPTYLVEGPIGSPFANQIGLGDTPALDAFSRLRVSNPSSSFDSQHEYDTSPIFWQNDITDTSGNATLTHLPDESGVLLTVEAEDVVINQTRNYHRYQPGKSQQILMTFAFGAGNAAVTKRVGYFDANNGIYLQQVGDTLSWVLRSNVTGTVVNNVVNQPDWSIDPMFTGKSLNPSGIKLDPTKSQIAIIDLEWLGVGRVRVGFIIGGQIIYVHEFINANNHTSSYMTTANLPVRYEISATAGLVGSGTMRQICSSVNSEGGFQDERFVTVGQGNVAARAVTTRLPIMAIRPKLTFNSIVNRTQIILERFSILTLTEGVYYELVWGGAITGGSWADVNATHSTVEINTGPTAISGGLVIEASHAFGNASGANVRAGTITQGGRPRLPLALAIDGTHPTTPFSDTLALVATSLAGATNVYGAINWRELR